MKKMWIATRAAELLSRANVDLEAWQVAGEEDVRENRPIAGDGCRTGRKIGELWHERPMKELNKE